MPMDSNEEIKELLYLLFHTTDLNRLINCGAQILHNPLSIFDANYYALAYSDTAGIKDALWISGMARGHSLYEYATILHLVESTYIENPDENKFIYHDVENFGDYRRRVIPLISNMVVVGFVSVLEYHQPFDDTSEELYQLVIGALTKEVVVQRAFRSYNQYGSSEALLSDLLHSNFSNKELFSQRVMGTDFEKLSNYRLISVNMKHFQFENPKNNNFKSVINRLFPKAWSVFIKEYAIFLIDCGKSENIPKASLDQLETILSAQSLRAGMSDCFCDLFEINRYYEQTMIAVRISKQLKSKDLIVVFDDYKLWYCANIVCEKGKDTFISVFVKKLAEYDAKAGSEYIKTLYHYLDSGKSLLETATNMHVHRNTIVYRLERMKTLFNMKTTSGYEDMQNYLSCMLILLAD